LQAKEQQVEDTYRIVAHGLQPGYSEAQATGLLAGLFKCSPARVKSMLGARGVVVKRALSLADATTYQGALERCGCTSRIEPEAAPVPAPAPAEFALTPFTAPELERVQDYAKQVLAILNEKFSGKAAYDVRSVEFLAAELNARRYKYTGALAVKIANLYGAFLGTVLINTYAHAQPVWVKTPEGVGIHFRKHGGRLLKIAFPITRVMKQIEHGEEFSILAFVLEQKQFLAEDPKPKKARVLKSKVVPEKGRRSILQINADGEQPFNIVVPHAMCCNCGTRKELHVIQVPLSKRRLNGGALKVDTEFPFCVPCVPTAHRVRPGWLELGLGYCAVLAAFVYGAVLPLDRAQTLGPHTGLWLALLFAALSGAAWYLMNRAAPPQTSPWQPVTLKTLKTGAAGIGKIGFRFSNRAYAQEFAKANRQEIKLGRVL
jgi:hypothetical protein